VVMKLLLDCSRLTIGGGIQVGLGVVEHAATDASLEVFLVCSSEMARQLAPEFVRLLSKCYVVGESVAAGGVEQIRQISAIECALSPDVVFTVFGPSYWRSRTVNLQGFALGKMLYADSRQGYPSRLTRWREQAVDSVKKMFLRRNADYFLVETEVVKYRLAELFDMPLDRIYVVGNSVSPVFERRYHDLAGDFHEDGQPFTVFVPASFYHHKNLEVVPRVAAALQLLGDLAVRFVFTLDPSSAGWARISQLAAQYGVASMLATVGEVPNQLMADHYLAADAVLCASLVESSTAVFPEAFLTGRPLIVSDRDFARQLCGSAALYFDPHDPQSIAATVLRLMKNSVLRNELVSAGRRALSEVYPSPTQKWKLQLEVLRLVVARGKP